jgi:fluoroacetyl-CoA thioesterase
LKPGLAKGASSSVLLTVGPEMFAQFDGVIVHPLFSTASMVYYMEWASRKIILPFLEEGEEGVGAEVSVRHLAPAAEGSRIKVIAEVIRIERNLIITSVEAIQCDAVIGRGEITQAILLQSKIKRFTEKTQSE